MSDKTKSASVCTRPFSNDQPMKSGCPTCGGGTLEI